MSLLFLPVAHVLGTGCGAHQAINTCLLSDSGLDQDNGGGDGEKYVDLKLNW